MDDPRHIDAADVVEKAMQMAMADQPLNFGHHTQNALEHLAKVDADLAGTSAIVLDLMTAQTCYRPPDYRLGDPDNADTPAIVEPMK